MKSRSKWPLYKKPQSKKEDVCPAVEILLASLREEPDRWVFSDNMLTVNNGKVSLWIGVGGVHAYKPAENYFAPHERKLLDEVVAKIFGDVRKLREQKAQTELAEAIYEIKPKLKVKG